MAKGGERLCRMAAPFLEGAACGGRRACSPFDLACEECPRARGVPPSEAGERAGEDKGVALEPRRREAGLWRPPQELGRLLAAGLGSTLLRSEALLTDFLGASARGRGRAFEAARGSPTSAPPPRDRWEMAGKGAPGVGPEESRGQSRRQRGHRYLQAGPPHCPGAPLLPRSHTSPCLHTQGTHSGSFWGFSSAPRFLSWEPESFLPKRA